MACLIASANAMKAKRSLSARNILNGVETRMSSAKMVLEELKKIPEDQHEERNKVDTLAIKNYFAKNLLEDCDKMYAAVTAENDDWDVEGEYAETICLMNDMLKCLKFTANGDDAECSKLEKLHNK